jgi:hypothetical protein
MAKAPEAKIRLYFSDPCVLTVHEFEQMKRGVDSHIVANAVGVGDRVLYQLVREHFGRYLEAREINEKREVARKRTSRVRCYRCKRQITLREARLVLLEGKQWSCDDCWDERLRS